MNRYFKKIGYTDHISSWESKGLCNEIIEIIEIIVYKLSSDLDFVFALENCLFSAVK